MTRREVREQLFILVYQREFYGDEEFEEQRDIYLQDQEFPLEIRKELLDKLEKMKEHEEEIDGKIQEYSHGWSLDRINMEELAILRIGVYEALYDEDVPVGVALNEAVELAKIYGSSGARSFINGILGNIVHE